MKQEILFIARVIHKMNFKMTFNTLQVNVIHHRNHKKSGPREKDVIGVKYNCTIEFLPLNPSLFVVIVFSGL